MSRLTVPAAEIYYEFSGKGPALVFAHGLGGNHMSCWQQGPFFKDRWTCITESYLGPETVEWVTSTFPATRLVRVTAGHSIYFERAEVFNRLVAEFLDAA